MSQDIFDLVIILTLVFFTFRGIRNGLIGEVAGIFSLVGGFWAARAWNAQLAPHLGFIADVSLRNIVACILIFIAVMLAIGLLARILKKVVAFSFVAWADKIGGAILGLAKGVLIWALLLIFIGKIFHDSQFIQDSRLMPYFQIVIDQIREWIPSDLAARTGI